MKRIAVTVVWILALTQLSLGQKSAVRCGGCEDTGSSNRAVSDELKKLDSELDEARARGDRPAFERMLAEQMISIDSEGSVSKKEAVLKEVKPQSEGNRFSIVAADVQVYSHGDTTIVTSNKTSKWEWKGGAYSDQYRETNTYLRKDGRWQLIASQQSHAAPPYSAKDVQLTLKVDEAQIRGNKKAAVVLVEFADYECSFCRRFAAGTLKEIERDYIDTGRIGYVFRDFPMENIHPYAVKASIAAECAGQQGRLWEMNQRLFADPMALKTDDLISHAQSLNLDMNRFRGCFEDYSSAASLRQRMHEASDLGIIGTPMFLVGVRNPATGTITALRMIEGAYPYDVFKATLETIIAARE